MTATAPRSSGFHFPAAIVGTGSKIILATVIITALVCILAHFPTEIAALLSGAAAMRPHQ